MKNDEFIWEMADYTWSPDSKWIAYSFVQYNRNSQIFVYNIETGKKYPVTDDFYDNLYPSFDANGKYLYYVSSRNFDLQMDFYEDNHVIATPQQVMAVASSGTARSRPSPAPGAGPGRRRRPSPSRSASTPRGWRSGPTRCPSRPGTISTSRPARARCCGPPSTPSPRPSTRRSSGPRARPSGRCTSSTWPSGRRPSSTTRSATSASRRTASSSSSGRTATSSRPRSTRPSGRRRSARSSTSRAWSTPSTSRRSGTRSSTTPGAGTATSSTTPNFHGRDWKAMGEKYRAYIPYLSSRAELNWVLSQMVGELCVSHTYIGGGDFGPAATPPSPVFTGLLGADLVADKATGLYRLAKIYGPTEINLDLPGPLVRPGHRRQGGRLPAGHQRHGRSRPATITSSCSRRRPARRSRSRSTPGRRWKGPGPTTSSPSGATTRSATSAGSRTTSGRSRRPPTAASATCTSTPWAAAASASSTSSGAPSATRTASSSTSAGTRAAGPSTSSSTSSSGS